MSIDVMTAVAAMPDVERFRGLVGAERDEMFLAVERSIRELLAVQAAMVSVVDRSASYVDDGHRSTRAWVQAVLNSSPATAVHHVQRASLLRELPQLAGEVAAGRLGQDQLRELTRLWSNERCRPHLPDSEQLLVGPARCLRYRDFCAVVQRWRAAADPDGGHRDHAMSRTGRHVRVFRVGAGGVLHAECDALTWEEMSEILDAHADSEYHADVAERNARYGDESAKYPLRRTHPQRLFDALQTIFFKAVGVRDPGWVQPTVNIMTTQADFDDAVREYFGQPREPGRSKRWRLCETDNGSPVDPTDLVVAALIGEVRRVVVTSHGRVIDLGRTSRVFTGAGRQAVLLTDRRCNHPGCEHNRNVQIDHVDGWVRHGLTNPFNGATTCPVHNLAKHRLGFTVTRDEHGWHHYRPDGSEITPRGS